MAVAVVEEFADETERSTKNYDAIRSKIDERLNETSDTGLIIHTAGWTDHCFRIFEVWESLDHFRLFRQETVLPIVEEILGTSNGIEPEITIYHLHNVVTP